MSLSKNARSRPPNLMDMPILVIREILGNVDFISMLNLRKVCEAFQYYIDKNFMHIALDHIRVHVQNKSIVNLIVANFKSKTFDFDFYKIRFEINNDGGCCVAVGQAYMMEQYHVKTNFLEEFAICLEGILKNLKTPLKSFKFMSSVEDQKPTIFQSIFGCCRSRNMKTRNSENLDFKAAAKAQKPVIDKVEKILKFMNPRIQTQKLSISCFEPENLSKITSNIDKKALKRLEDYRMQSVEEEMQKVDLDGILNFRSFSNLNHLRVRNMIMSSSFLSISHIPNRELCFVLLAGEQEIVEKECPSFKPADIHEQKPLPWGSIDFDIRFDT